jgi:alpha-L-fucosidase
MGLYLSPWDRNHADYGTGKYITYYRNQIEELLTQYGEVFEFWIDGANGGTGYYGGANEDRRVDRKTYYDWPVTFELVKKLQPEIVIFSDAGPDTRWVGNEAGWAGETNWSPLRRDEFWPGSPYYKQLTSGHEDGTHWVPTEIDVSIRPGWYYHPYEDHKVHSLPHLLDIYYHSVGRNGNLLLNFPVDQRGLIHENDVEQVMKLAATLKKDFANNLVSGKKASATNTRGDHRKFAPRNVLDDKKDSYWSTDDEVTAASLTIDPGEEVVFNRLLLQEYIRLGQRVKEFTVDALMGEEWKEIAAATTIGYKRILRLPTTKASKIRLNIKQAKASPLISNLELYLAPKVLTEPYVSRDKQGMVSLSAADPEAKIYYTVDGSDPDPSSTPYTTPFSVKGKKVIKAVAVDDQNGLLSPVSAVKFDVAKELWSVVSPADDPARSHRAIDDDPSTTWIFDVERFPSETVIDLGESYMISGITYLPDQGRWVAGIIEEGAIYVSENGKQWGDPVVAGELPNMQNSPVLQRIPFPEKRGRYLKIEVLRTVNEDKRVGIAEIGVLTR